MICAMVNSNCATIKEGSLLVYANFIFLGGQIINIIVIKLGRLLLLTWSKVLTISLVS